MCEHGPEAPADRFSHEALFYGDMDEFLAGTVDFVRDGVLRGEPVLVAVFPEKADRMRAMLGDEADGALFVDMLSIGKNPACIIPVWSDFVRDNVAEGRPARGIGEPIWAGRTDAELIECDHHESLLNLAFDGGPPWRLLCPYDTSVLADDVLEGARRNHPTLIAGGRFEQSDHYREPTDPFSGPLSPVPGSATGLDFSNGDLAAVRRFVQGDAATAGLTQARAEDLVVAVNELATNSLVHGGGRGTLRMWSEDGSLVCEVRDDGQFVKPLVGRERPADDYPGGRGLWMVNRLCDLVQIRSGQGWNLVRVHLTQ